MMWLSCCEAVATAAKLQSLPAQGRTIPQMSIQVFLKGQNVKTEKAAHKSSNVLADLAVAGMFAKRISKKSIQVIVDLPWAAVKQHYKIPEGSFVVIPKILPPRAPFGLVLAYPIANQESDGKRKQAELWARATRF